jgi:hypothetical protein
LYLDAEIIEEQLKRGHPGVASALRSLLASGAEVRISRWTYQELVEQPSIPRTAAANRELIKDLGLTVEGPTPLAPRVDVRLANEAGRRVASERDAQLIAAARAGGGEIFSTDRVFRNNPRGVEQRFGVRVVPEAVGLGPAATGSVKDYRVARQIMGLEPIDVSLSGTVIRRPGGGSPPPSPSGGGGVAPPRTVPPSTGGTVGTPGPPETPAKPTVSKPTARKPAVSKPTVLKPAVSKPTTSKPTRSTATTDVSSPRSGAERGERSTALIGNTAARIAGAMLNQTMSDVANLAEQTGDKDPDDQLDGGGRGRRRRALRPPRPRPERGLPLGPVAGLQLVHPRPVHTVAAGHLRRRLTINEQGSQNQARLRHARASRPTLTVADVLRDVSPMS